MITLPIEINIDIQTISLIVSITSAIVALILSLYNLFKDNRPLSIIPAEKPDIFSGRIGCYADKGAFKSVIKSNVNCIIRFRFINPKDYPITLFDINIFGKDNKVIEFYREANLRPEFRKQIHILRPYVQASFQVFFPENEYHKINPGSMVHMDLIMPMENLQSLESDEITVYFRDSNPTLFKNKSPLPKGAKLHYRHHSYKYKIPSYTFQEEEEEE